MLNITVPKDNPKFAEIVQGTIGAIKAEKSLPKSPGMAKAGRLFLCAGAALVYQAALTLNPPEADHIAQRMVDGGKWQIVEEGKKLGLDPFFVAGAVILNDDHPDEVRRERMLDYFQSLA